MEWNWTGRLMTSCYQYEPMYGIKAKGILGEHYTISPRWPFPPQVFTLIVLPYIIVPSAQIPRLSNLNRVARVLYCGQVALISLCCSSIKRQPCL